MLVEVGKFCNSRVNNFLTPRLASKGLTSSLKGEMHMFSGLFQLKNNDATRSEGMQGTDGTLLFLRVEQSLSERAYVRGQLWRHSLSIFFHAP